MASHSKSQSNSILVPRLSALPSRQFSLTDQLMEVEMDGQGRREKGNEWNREKAQDRGHGKGLANKKVYIGSGNQQNEFQEVRSTKNGIGLFVNQTNRGYPPLTIQLSKEPESPQFPCTPISSPEDCLLSNMGTQLNFYKNLLQNAQKQISLYKQQNTQLRTENAQLAAVVDSYQKYQQKIEVSEKNEQGNYLKQIQYLMDRLEEYQGLISKLEDKIVMLNYVIKKRQYEHKCDEIYEGFEQSCWVVHEKQKQLSKKITNKPYTVQSPNPCSKPHSKPPQNLTQKYLDFEIQDMDSRSNTIPNRMQKSRKIYQNGRDRQGEVLETPIRAQNRMNKKITDTTAQNQISLSGEKSVRDKEKKGRKQDSVENQHSFQMSIQQKFKERYRLQNPNKEADGNKLTDLRKKAIEARRDRINYLKAQKKQTLTKQSNSNNSQYSCYCPHKKFKTESSLSKFQQNFELEYENEIQQKFISNFARNADIHNSNKSNSHKNNNNNSHNYQECSQDSHNKTQTEIKLRKNYENQWREISTKRGDCVTPRPKRETGARINNRD